MSENCDVLRASREGVLAQIARYEQNRNPAQAQALASARSVLTSVEYQLAECEAALAIAAATESSSTATDSSRLMAYGAGVAGLLAGLVIVKLARRRKRR